MHREKLSLNRWSVVKVWIYLNNWRLNCVHFVNLFWPSNEFLPRFSKQINNLITCYNSIIVWWDRKKMHETNYVNLSCIDYYPHLTDRKSLTFAQSTRIVHQTKTPDVKQFCWLQTETNTLCYNLINWHVNPKQWCASEKLCIHKTKMLIQTENPFGCVFFLSFFTPTIPVATMWQLRLTSIIVSWNVESGIFSETHVKFHHFDVHILII